jgi:hypothetical protein
MILADVQPV